MSINCCVLGCFDRGKFSLPLESPSIWKNWLKSCPYLQHYNLRQLTGKRICSKHFIPEHFDTNTNLLLENAVPLLNLPKLLETTNENSEEGTQTDEETKEEIQIIEDYIDPSLYFLVDESNHYDAEESITLPFQQLENLEYDPLQMTPKQSPIDYDNCEEVIAHSPSPVPIPFNEPPQFTEKTENSQSPIVKPQPMKVPRIVLRRLPPILNYGRVRLLSSVVSKSPSTKQNDNQIPHNSEVNNLKKHFGLPRGPMDSHVQKKQLLKPNVLSINSLTQITSYLEEHNLSSTFGKTLTESQIRLTGTACEDIHYTTKEKIFALSLVKVSPNGYEFMQGQLGLPSKYNINSMLYDIPLRPGINEFVFQYLANAAKHKNEQEKECVLLFSEMEIDKCVKFNVHTGIIEGFQDLGSGKRANNVGDKALVFMLCGLFQLWKLPIAYYFTGDLIERNNLIYKRILTEIVMAIFEAGFVVKATISDHSSTNVEAINSFLADNNNSVDNIYYEIQNKHLFHIYDVTDIMKYLKFNTRNDNQQKETLFQIDSEILLSLCQLKSPGREQEFWNTALTKLNSMKFDLQDGQSKPFPINLLINNVKTTKKVWEDLQARSCAFVRRLNLKPLNYLFSKIRDNRLNSNSNQFILAYRGILINNLTSCKSLYTNSATESNDDGNKILGVLENFINPKKYSPYQYDVDLENIIYYTERIVSKELPVFKALCTFFVWNMPYKDCSKCQQLMLSTDQNINSAVWKTISLVDELLPEMVNSHIYSLILILQHEIDVSSFTCAEHRTMFFRIMCIFVIKLRAKQWCNNFNIQKGYCKT